MGDWHLDDDEEPGPRDEPYGRREASGVYVEDEEELGLDFSSRPRHLHSTGRLLSFYDTLRERIVRAIERRGGRASGGVTKALLLVPDVFILLVRLALDRRVPGAARAMIGGALAYFVLPIDLLPEAVLGPVGYLDDLVLAVAVLTQAFGGGLKPYARKHWSGPEDLRIVLSDISAGAEQLLGNRLYDRLRRFLGRRGVELGEER